ncbi:membrane protein [Roseibium sp. TrichSKD4]|uniref:YeiH family protein n=1 Tax=Roseibium sp. TrichSKD4 TaxID=744980 RepID=UPI0001E56DDF|nr:putative sulfate exporter family transporter [Roseibium sp. TrichSKD4]EFO33308.1 membrane protein [Roseibium sp. TrichSKD4]
MDSSDRRPWTGILENGQDGLLGKVRPLLPGLLIAFVIALASQFIAEHYGAPAMLLALLLGIALNFLSSDPQCKEGIAFAARPLLRIGIVLLGLRISFDMVVSLGWPVVSMVIAGVICTIGFGLACARLFGFQDRVGFLTGGAVAICGASAAMAIAAILPQDEKSEDRLVFTVVGVTVLSTVAMVVYPIIGSVLFGSDQAIGIFLGATIHDVAQVVGAGFSVSNEAGETATLVKLLRVAMLAPVIVAASLIMKAMGSKGREVSGKVPLVPLFVAGFVALATLNSLVTLPAVIVETSVTLSKWCLLTAIAAVGLKTIPKDLLKIGSKAAMLIIGETLFLAILICVVLFALP